MKKGERKKGARAFEREREKKESNTSEKMYVRVLEEPATSDGGYAPWKSDGWVERTRLRTKRTRRRVGRSERGIGGLGGIRIPYPPFARGGRMQRSERSRRW